MLLPEEVIAPPFTDAELDSYFEWESVPEDDRDPTLDEPRPARWAVSGTASAEWAMRRYAHTVAEIEEIEEQAVEFIEQIKRWKLERTLPLEHRANFFHHHLTEWLRAHREDPEDGRASIPLPSGTITSRKVPARPEVVKEAEEEFIAWARTHAPGTVKAKWSPVMAAIRSTIHFPEDGRPIYADNDGEVFEVPGVVLVPEHVNYDCKPAKP